jgi:PAN domain
VHLRHLIIASAFIVASGIPGPALAQDAFSKNTDRPGGDYRSFDINGDAEACRETCGRERQCRAWTFVKAPNTWHGLQRPSARCWLKNVVPPARANPCCTSGVTGGQRIDPG